MGDRGQVYIEDTGVYLYTHWSATELPNMVKEALKKRWRWNDEEYLTRIILDQMKGDDKGETGFGIGTEKHSDVWQVVKINCVKQTVNIDGDVKSFEDFIK